LRAFSAKCAPDDHLFENLLRDQTSQHVTEATGRELEMQDGLYSYAPSLAMPAQNGNL
jgi:hypothetical protein